MCKRIRAHILARRAPPGSSPGYAPAAVALGRLLVAAERRALPVASVSVATSDRQRATARPQVPRSAAERIAPRTLTRMGEHETNNPQYINHVARYRLHNRRSPSKCPARALRP
ncbi:hypothetical protein ERY430_40937 [Erythrobacter sp. EC-HK427]|nr:hypothetical protein ERY430_40937 [Erythrobacter sp. EC-HK427]